VLASAVQSDPDDFNTMRQPEQIPPVCHTPSSSAACTELFTIKFNQKTAITTI